MMFVSRMERDFNFVIPFKCRSPEFLISVGIVRCLRISYFIFVVLISVLELRFMHASFRHSRWSSLVVALLIVGSLPRFGCVCADGLHLPFCQKLVHQVFNQLDNAFSDSANPKKCPCCGNCHSEPILPERGCNGSEDPCECHVTLEGPQWNSSDRIELPLHGSFKFFSPLASPSLLPILVMASRVLPVDSGPPPTANLVDVVRLNV